MTSPGGALSGSLPLYRLYQLVDGPAAVAAIEPHSAAGFAREVGTDPEIFFARQTVAAVADCARTHDLPIGALPHS